MTEIVYNEKQLKECPFCHKPGYLMRNDITGYFGNYHYYVGCNNATCKIRPATRKIDDIYRRWEQAVDIVAAEWNERGEEK